MSTRNSIDCLLAAITYIPIFLLQVGMQPLGYVAATTQDADAADQVYTHTFT